MSIKVMDTDDLPNSRRSGYSHFALAEQAILNPGKWVTDDSDDMPQMSGPSVRSGALVAYRPAGSFQLRRVGPVGDQQTYVCFLGVPKEPWEPGNLTPYLEVKRTLNPKRVPADAPDRVVKLLRKARK